MQIVIFAINICNLISTLHAKFDTTENPAGHPLLLHREIRYRLDYIVLACQRNAKFHTRRAASHKLAVPLLVI